MICYIYNIDFVMSDTVSDINNEFDDYQLVLSLKDKKLKILVDLDNDNECNELISLLGEVKDKDIVL